MPPAGILVLNGYSLALKGPVETARPHQAKAFSRQQAAPGMPIEEVVVFFGLEDGGMRKSNAGSQEARARRYVSVDQPIAVLPKGCSSPSITKGHPG